MFFALDTGIRDSLDFLRTRRDGCCAYEMIVQQLISRSCSVKLGTLGMDRISDCSFLFTLILEYTHIT